VGKPVDMERVAEVIEDLRARGIDVIRVSYPDLIGTDRGRDVLIDELPTAMGHGIAFCRAVFHTSPRGDVVPVQGGLEDGLPDIKVVPDLATLTDLPWEPGAAWCLGETFAQGGDPAPESPRELARSVAAKLAEIGLSAVIGPELESTSWSPTPPATAAGSATPTSPATSTSSAARATRRASRCRCCGTCATPTSR
jgi:glutamine synthetase